MPNRRPVHRAIGLQTSAQRRAAYDAARPSPSRIYGRRWQVLRRWYLNRHPICECEDGCGYPAQIVDHIRSHHGDPQLLYDVTNLRALTKSCHDRKTAARDGGFGNPLRSNG